MRPSKKLHIYVGNKAKILLSSQIKYRKIYDKHIKYRGK